MTTKTIRILPQIPGFQKEALGADVADGPHTFSRWTSPKKTFIVLSAKPQLEATVTQATKIGQITTIKKDIKVPSESIKAFYISSDMPCILAGEEHFVCKLIPVDPQDQSFHILDVSTNELIADEKVKNDLDILLTSNNRRHFILAYLNIPSSDALQACHLMAIPMGQAPVELDDIPSSYAENHTFDELMIRTTL